MKKWNCPEIRTPEFITDMLKQPHILIGGTSGAGKSVALNDFLFALLQFAPSEARFLLVDPKGIELLDYADLPHTIAHVTKPEEIDHAIQWAAGEMDARFSEMIPRREKISHRPDVYIIIDEYIDVKTQCSKETVKELVRIASKGRASKVHIILCTQRPTSEYLDSAIKANFSTVLALRTASTQESRNLIDMNECKDLPTNGFAYYKSPTMRDPERVTIPFLPQSEILSLVQFWTAQAAA